MADISLAELKRRLRMQQPRGQIALADLRLTQEHVAARFRSVENIVVEVVSFAGCRAEWLKPRNSSPDRFFLYLHGGAFVGGSCATHRPLAAKIAIEAQMRGLLLQYRLAPEHPWPAAEEDVYATWCELLSAVTLPKHIYLIADSAGANLAMRLLLRLRDEGRLLPRAVCLLSPWIDLDLGSESIDACASSDPTLQSTQLERFAELYRGHGQGPQILGEDLKRLPEFLIHAGSDEILRDDAARLAEELTGAGVPTRLEIWPGLFHVWHAFWPWLAEARTGIAGIAAFLNR